MTDVNTLSHDYIAPLATYINDNFRQSEGNNVKARAAYFGLASLSLLTSAVDGVFASALAFKGFLHGGKNIFYCENSLAQLNDVRKIFTRPYMNLVKMVNPTFSFKGMHTNTMKGHGFLSDYTFQVIGSKCLEKIDIEKVSHKRIAVCVVAVCMIFARFFDAILAIPLCTASIVTGGKYQVLNVLAYRTSQAGGIIFDLTWLTICFLDTQHVGQYLHSKDSQLSIRVVLGLEAEAARKETSEVPNRDTRRAEGEDDGDGESGEGGLLNGINNKAKESEEALLSS